MAAVFLDASHAIALSASTGQHHKQAEIIAEQLEAEGTRLVTTRVVILEIGNALAKFRYRNAVINLLDSLEKDPNVEIIPISEQFVYEKAFQLYRDRPDKEWSITDCISFIVMQDRKLIEALTAEEHFRQAGFRVMLRESL